MSSLAEHASLCLQLDERNGSSSRINVTGSSDDDEAYNLKKFSGNHPMSHCPRFSSPGMPFPGSSEPKSNDIYTRGEILFRLTQKSRNARPGFPYHLICIMHRNADIGLPDPKFRSSPPEAPGLVGDSTVFDGDSGPVT